MSCCWWRRQRRGPRRQSRRARPPGQTLAGGVDAARHELLGSVSFLPSRRTTRRRLPQRPLRHGEGGCGVAGDVRDGDGGNNSRLFSMSDGDCHLEFLCRRGPPSLPAWTDSSTVAAVNLEFNRLDLSGFVDVIQPERFPNSLNGGGTSDSLK